MRSSGRLTPEQLAAIAQASLVNSAALIDEARALYEVGALGRAYALAILAGEEFGKCQLAIGSIGRGIERDEYWKEWWSVFYGHGPKLARAAEIAGRIISAELLDPFLEILRTALNEQRREAGFYVDVAGGAPVSPSAAISRGEAEDAVVAFGEVIDLYVAMFEDVGLAQAYVNANAGPAVDMRAALDSRDRERIRSTWEATTERRLNDEELDLIMKGLR